MKDLRIVIRDEEKLKDFEAAKQKAEAELGIALRDNEFVLRVVYQHIKSVSSSMDCEPMNVDGINKAGGHALDAFAAILGMPSREKGETDCEYRKRIYIQDELEG